MIPINAAYGGIWTLLPLYLLELGGSVIDVGFAGTVFNLAVIPGSLVWGYLADAYPRRRTVMHAATVVIATVIAAKFLTSSIPILVLLYAMYGFLSTAYTPTTQLLIMEFTLKRDWAQEFGRMSSASSLGFVLGVAPGVIWTRYLPLNTYLVYCLILQLIALALIRKIREPQRTIEREAITFSLDAFVSRIRELPLFFLKVPRKSDFVRFHRMAGLGLTQTLPLLFIAMTLFFSGASMFFTSFTPFLKSRDVPDFEVFVVYLLLFASNTISFRYAGKIAQKFAPSRVTSLSMLVRGLTLLSAYSLTLLSTSTQVIIASLLILAIVGASFTLANTASSVIIYHNLEPGRKGELLGIYSALTGIGLLSGAFVSGFVSYHLAYGITFLIAGAVVLGSLVMFKRAAAQG